MLSFYFRYKICELLRLHKALAVVIVLVINGFGPNVLAATKVLKMPTSGRALPSIDAYVNGLYVGDKELYLGVDDKDYIIRTPFHGLKDRSDKSFGVYTDSERLKFASTMSRGFWMVAPAKKDVLLIMDGIKLVTATYYIPDKQYSSKRTVPWDVLRPARDRGGEPTRSEVAQLRRRFKKAYKATVTKRFFGLTALPPGWLAGKGRNYLVTTRIPGFPVLAMQCSPDALSACMLARQCFAQGLPKFNASLAGAAISKKRRLFIVGDSATNKLYLLRYRSCFDLRKVGERVLPDKLRSLSGVHVDREDRLWVTTQKNDDYLNASAYVWEAQDW